MLNYEQLDFIADSYNFTLSLLILFFLIKSYKADSKQRFQTNLTLVSSYLTLIYGVMLLDKLFLIWPSLNLDFSTHTAFALASVLLLMHWRIFKPLFWIVSFLAYLLLMEYQKYHTVADMLSTCFVMIPLYFTAGMIVHRKTKNKFLSCNEFFH